MGQTLLDNKEFRKSIEYLNDYVSKSKNPDATSYYYIGLAYTGLEEYEIALEYFDDALGIKPGDEKFLKDRNSCAKQIRKESNFFCFDVHSIKIKMFKFNFEAKQMILIQIKKKNFANIFNKIIYSFSIKNILSELDFKNNK